MTSPFDFLNQINSTKHNIIRSGEARESEYVPFIVNRTLSYFPDTLMLANEMNMHHQMDSLLQFDYLINTVRPRKRFSKWAKKQENGDIEVVKQYFKLNDRHAASALSVLSPEQVAIIRTKMHTGGKNEQHRRLASTNKTPKGR